MSDPTDRFTEDAKAVCNQALREALSLGHNYIGPEHLLMALLRDTKGGVTLVRLLHSIVTGPKR